ncbi:pimeloyl-ACP methyl ester carboxylesterase [Methylopila capsulata]|uniref:Alpha/beta hydrolase n=1 Tax=Methylopila capsulata TaxID=61654 RepID=A0A9W6MRQ4_9HYPH|nr:alpha/beta hydrolase [Methylopila capsulata]MBM7850190.1 pimeloyl-ACP methyl ester carboxylesterase [Methylopila capsulata]GLK55482.1 alpha/beta hydrolase [Methylopila capsulata]
MTIEVVDRRIATTHGLRLHVRIWSPLEPRGLPVVCLPGLARGLEDFTELAEHLVSPVGGDRRVVAISARGRGLSDRDPIPARYDVRVEAGDVLAVADALGLAHAALIGTSRGGLQAMALGALRPGFGRAVILNDVGPVIELQGLLRIRRYLAAATAPRTWDEAETAVVDLFGARFPALGPDGFRRMARRTWRETSGGGLVPLADPALTRSLESLDLEKPLPTLWPLFDGLAGVPLMAIRGETSDILSAETLRAMKARRPDLVVLDVPGQGHAPQLGDPATLSAITAFLASSETSAKLSLAG